MTISPDVVFEIAINLCPPDADINAIKTTLKNQFLPPQLGVFPDPLSVCGPNTKITPNGNVLTVGLWIDTEGFTQGQLMDALVTSSFISGNRTAALFVSTEMIQFKAAADWAQRDKHDGRVTSRQYD